MFLPAKAPLRRDLSVARLRDTARRKMRSFLLPDQDLLTVLYGEHIKLADPLRYDLSDRILGLYNAGPRHEPLDLRRVRENSAVIHCCGKNKPWNGHYAGVLGVFCREPAAGTD